MMPCMGQKQTHIHEHAYGKPRVRVPRVGHVARATGCRPRSYRTRYATNVANEHVFDANARGTYSESHDDRRPGAKVQCRCSSHNLVRNGNRNAICRVEGTDFTDTRYRHGVVCAAFTVAGVRVDGILIWVGISKKSKRRKEK